MPSIEQTAGLSLASGASQRSTNTISGAAECGDSGGQIWRVLSRGASASLVIQISGAGLAFAIQILLARLMPVQQYGVYIYVLTWINLLLIPALVGMDKASIKYVAAYRADSPAMLSGFLSGSRKLVLLASMVIGAVGAGLVVFLSHQQSANEQLAFVIGLLLLPLISQIHLTESVFRGLKQILRAGLYTNIIRPVIFVVLIGAVLLVGAPITPAWIFSLLVCASVAVLLIARHESNKALMPLIYGIGQAPFQREWLITALPLLLLSIIQLSLKKTDIVMIGALNSAAEAGIYSAATRIADLVAFGLIAFNAIVAPLIAETYSRGHQARLQQLLKVAAFMSFGITLGITIMLIVLGPTLLGLFGEAFLTSYKSLLILLVAQLINACCGPVGFLMTMTRYQYQAALIFGSAALINVVLNALLIPPLGMVGAAVGTAVAIVYWNVAALVFVIVKMRLNPTIFQLVR